METLMVKKRMPGRPRLEKMMREDPVELLQLLLDRNTQESSTELARRCRVPSSNIRALRNGQYRSMRTEPFMRLLSTLLSDEGYELQIGVR